ncbi:MAG: N,N-dimethylformamidase beta subunit family domain-containing protein, partial [Gammaproteobacteria bacterium]
MDKADRSKKITGYCEPLSVRAGENISLFASSLTPVSAKLELVRIICGDPTRSGPGFEERELHSDLPEALELSYQPVVPGSYGEIDLSGFTLNRSFKIDVHVFPTHAEGEQTVLSINTLNDQSIALKVSNRQFFLDLAGTQVALQNDSLPMNKWFRVEIDVKFGLDGEIVTRILTLETRSPGRDIGNRSWNTTETFDLPNGLGALNTCLIAASLGGGRFDGRISNPKVCLDDESFQWDFSKRISGRELIDTGDHERHGMLYQLPARAVTGPKWDGTQQNWTACPEHYDAVHFHSDDLYDAGWPQAEELSLPTDLPSGIYAFRLTRGDEVDRIPFFVRPAVDGPTAKIALLMSSCTYMAYANHRMLIEGASFVAAKSRLRPEHEYIREHREIGLSMYEKHVDGSGVMYSSRRRPILNLRPGADGWNFTPDTDIYAFLEHLDLDVDVIADEDVHREGFQALSPYDVVVTCTHPEYWSTNMLDALEQWLRDGGRLLYLGGNGFYWRVAFSDAWPGAIELRRCEDGVRNWETGPGESYHSFNGEYGGMWRRLGRAPNDLVGIGFAAQGFERAVAYRRGDPSFDSRAAWIFDSVEGELIGTSGLGGGAAGQEIDSFNEALGSPAHALVLASATDFGPDMTRTKEELDASIVVPDPDPVVRADMVFFETPAGGAVFSVGSISWFGALARNQYDNDVATITENVVRRFLDPSAFT